MGMVTRQNLHTHSTLCDGKSTLREQVESAISHGLESLGFSSHAWTGFSFDECGIAKEDIDVYLEEIDRLQEEFSGKIRLYKAFEYESRDIYGMNPEIDARLDYSIGSVHFFWLSDKAMAIDNTVPEFLGALEAYGSQKKAMESYFEEVVRFASVSDYTITGHFDLVTKFIEKADLSFYKEDWYGKLALEALDAVIDKGKIFEVNTGAIGRGHRTSPYPAPFLLSRLIERRIPLILTSDCHWAPAITCYFEEAEEMIRSLGGKELYAFDGKGFKAYSL